MSAQPFVVPKFVLKLPNSSKFTLASGISVAFSRMFVRSSVTKVQLLNHSFPDPVRMDKLLKIHIECTLT